MRQGKREKTTTMTENGVRKKGAAMLFRWFLHACAMWVVCSPLHGVGMEITQKQDSALDMSESADSQLIITKEAGILTHESYALRSRKPLTIENRGIIETIREDDDQPRHYVSVDLGEDKHYVQNAAYAAPAQTQLTTLINTGIIRGPNDAIKSRYTMDIFIKNDKGALIYGKDHAIILNSGRIENKGNILNDKVKYPDVRRGAIYFFGKDSSVENVVDNYGTIETHDGLISIRFAEGQNTLILRKNSRLEGEVWAEGIDERTKNTLILKDSGEMRSDIYGFHTLRIEGDAQGWGIKNVEAKEKTTVVSGILAVDGRLRSDTVEVLENTTLSGYGIVAGSVHNMGGTITGGTIAKKKDLPERPGELTIVGDYSGDAGSVFLVRVRGPTDIAEANDRLVIGGQADFSQTTIRLQFLRHVSEKLYKESNVYTIVKPLEGDEGAQGSYNFLEVESGDYAFFMPPHIDDHGHLTLEFINKTDPFVRPGLDANQRAVARALSALYQEVRNDSYAPAQKIDFLNTLLTLDKEEAVTIFKNQNAEIYGDFIVSARKRGVHFLDEIYVNGTRTLCLQQTLCAWTSLTGTYDSLKGKKKDKQIDTYGFTAILWSPTVGLNWHVMKELGLGIVAGYERSVIKTDKALTQSGTGHSIRVGVYGRYAPSFLDGFHLIGVVTYVFHAMHAQRTLRMQDTTYHGDGNARLHQVAGSLEAGWDFSPVPYITVTPIGRFDYVGVWQGEIHESGEEYRMDINAKALGYPMLLVGARAKVRVPFVIPLMLSGQVGWVHNFQARSFTLDSHASSFMRGTPFQTHTTGGSPNTAHVDVGVETLFGKFISTSARYTGDFSGRENGHMLSIGLGLQW